MVLVGPFPNALAPVPVEHVDLSAAAPQEVTGYKRNCDPNERHMDG